MEPGSCRVLCKKLWVFFFLQLRAACGGCQSRLMGGRWLRGQHENVWCALERGGRGEILLQNDAALRKALC